MVGNNLTLSDFLNMEIIRIGNEASIIFDYYKGHPISLIGFMTKSSLSDFEIAEEAYHYYLSLSEEIDRIKNL